MSFFLVWHFCNKYIQSLDFAWAFLPLFLHYGCCFCARGHNLSEIYVSSTSLITLRDHIIILFPLIFVTAFFIFCILCVVVFARGNIRQKWSAVSSSDRISCDEAGFKTQTSFLHINYQGLRQCRPAHFVMWRWDQGKEFLQITTSQRTNYKDCSRYELALTRMQERCGVSVTA